MVLVWEASSTGQRLECWDSSIVRRSFSWILLPFIKIAVTVWAEEGYTRQTDS